MPLPNGTDRFAAEGLLIRDRRHFIETISLHNRLNVAYVCEALNIRDRAEAAVKRYEAKVKEELT